MAASVASETTGWASMSLAVDSKIELPCHKCGYDLRAHPADGNCPECNASVAESKRIAAIPRRPRWQDSDPRWRRRMLAGVWLLVLLPLMAALRALNIEVPVPPVFDYLPPLRNTDETLMSNFQLFESLVFCVGMVLLFAKERGRQKNAWDWTRRWGVFVSYVVFVLIISSFLLICGLVGIGISAMFISQPPLYQPPITQPLLSASAFLLLYGPHSGTAAYLWQIVFASMLVMLACARMFDAMQSTGRKRLAMILLAPLVLFAIVHLLQTAWYVIDPNSGVIESVSQIYFSPGWIGSGGSVVRYFPRLHSQEALKWACVLAIALVLTTAQINSWRYDRSKRSPIAGQS